MEGENSENLKKSINNANITTENPLWKKYKQNCENQEKAICEKFELFQNIPSSHPNYSIELADYINYGFDLNYFAEYFKTKLEYMKFVEIMNMRQLVFRIECLRYRGYQISDSGDFMTTNLLTYEDGCKSVIAVINSIFNSNAKEFLASEDFENLEEILTRAIDYESLNIKFKLSSKDTELFTNIRKTLRNQLLSDELSIYEKASIRKIINDIQTLIKFEFSSVKCVEDHTTSLKHNLSNSSDESHNKKIKLVRNNKIKDEEVEVVEVGMEIEDISENLTTPFIKQEE